MNPPKRSVKKRIAIGVSAAAISFGAVGGGLAVATGALTDGDRVTIHEPLGATSGSPSSWPTNARGQTYGSLLNSSSSTTDPDLAQAIATNGQQGYVDSSQLNSAGPSSPAAAVAQQRADNAGKYIPVFAENGTTVIGQFEVSEPPSSADPPGVAEGSSPPTTSLDRTLAPRRRPRARSLP